MDASSKLAVAGVATVAIMVGGYIGYGQYARGRDTDQAQQDSASHRNATEPAQRQPRASQLPASRIASDITELRTQYRRLTPDERCVDGIVILVNASTHAQPDSTGKRVRCSGEYAER
jgi:hypothetical protein